MLQVLFKQFQSRFIEATTAQSYVNKFTATIENIKHEYKHSSEQNNSNEENKKNEVFKYSVYCSTIKIPSCC